MSGAATIDGVQFARERGVATGTLGIERLPRLAAMGCERAALHYAVRGGRGAGGHLGLTVELTGPLELRCQRCLRPLTLELALATELELAPTQAAIDLAEDGVDRVLATKSMSIAELVEDEAILALPMVPMHERCEGSGAGDALARASPFEALARRKQGAGPKC